MKNTQITIVPEAPFAGANNSAKVVNMRPDCQTGHLVPTGNYNSFATLAGKPLLTMESGGSTFIFSWDNGRLMVFNGVSSAPVMAMTECPTAAMADGDSAVFMRRGLMPLRLRRRSVGGLSVWTDVSPASDLPAVRFECVQRQKRSVATDAFSLEGDYAHWTGPMSEADRKTLGAVFGDAYCRLAEQARTAGVFAQPVMAWWRLVDDSGREIHRSMPVLISADGVQGAERIEAKVKLQGSYFRQVQPAAVSVETFLPGVRVDRASSQPWTVEVLMTPPLETVRLDAAGEASYTFNGSTSTEASLLVGLPACMPAAMMAELMLDRLDAVSQVVVRLPASEATDTALPLALPRLKSVRAEQSALLATLARPLTAEHAEPADQCRAPHSFSAGAVACVGDMALWGDITPVRCRPAGVDELAVLTDSSQAWAGGVRAVTTGGEVLADTGSGQRHAPQKLSALIAYPLAACSSITLQLSSAATGGRRSQTFALSPTPSGRWAIFTSPGLKPIDPAEWEAAEQALQPVDEGSAPALTSTILAAPATDPLAPDCGITLSGGSVKAITSASRTSSAWDFARRHLYAFTDNAIFSLAVNSARTLCSAHMIGPCGVASDELVACGADGVYAVTADGRLVRVAGSTVNEVCRYISCNALGWSSMHGGELWCALKEGGVRLICSGYRTVELTGIDAVHMATASNGRLWIIGKEGGITDTAQPVVNGFTAVRWCKQLQLPAAAGHALRLAHIDWDFTSPITTGRLTVSGHNGNAEHARVLGGFRLSGAVNAPLRRRIPLVAPFRFIVVEFSGNVTGATRPGTLTFTFESHGKH